MPRLFSLTLLLLIWSGFLCSTDSAENAAVVTNECLETQSTDASTTGSSPPSSHSRNAIPEDCGLVYANIPDIHEWGVFTMVPRQKGSPVNRFGDIIIQWPDPSPMRHDPSLCEDDACPPRQGLLQYTWNGQETGGHNEGRKRVESVVTGLGMCARTTSEAARKHNIIPLVPRVDEGGLTRFDSPGAGAITQYHNYTWWFTKDVEAGEELLYSSSGKIPIIAGDQMTDTRVAPSKPSLDYLKKNGYCIDNIRPRKSRVKEAGRGAFATRQIPEGAIVAPVPVVPVKREELMAKDNTHHKSKEQLLLNYCLGSNTSEWLLFPFSPSINLVNHFHDPNVKLQWSNSSLETIGQYRHSPDTNKNPPILMLEMVATKPIQEGVEIYMDYGQAWEDAWWKHTKEIWKPINEHYTPSYVMDDAIRMLRTEQEQKEHPYPNNVFTSCFYRYSDRTEEERTIAKQMNQKDSASLNSFRWKLTKGLYDLKNLRPCSVLKRLEDSKGRSAYAVRMFNRHGLDEDERIPEDQLHIVTHVPRAAIRFSDKAGTTDQHLTFAFRHEVGFPGINFLEEALRPQ
ncbi:SET methyltransferase domain containing protein [Nitzschia inconspicua]|uniref:SET methyltransferase domain containing protein n=1 Tax=Nitzschia inconspicua TaxID=303405 RepID=A0A9K3KQ13_9STRA|nr:SET methyltransferase domain containing protein [Nitzschia inconspicua]